MLKTMGEAYFALKEFYSIHDQVVEWVNLCINNKIITIYISIQHSAFSTSGKRMGAKHTLLPDGQPPTVAFTMLAQLCGPNANEMEMEAGEEKRALYGKENGNETYSATRWLVPNCSIHCACTAVWPKRLRNGDGS